ncbi:MAG: T9SS type A sorting domain-containing protein [Ignavibacteriales bacterium]
MKKSQALLLVLIFTIKIISQDFQKSLGVEIGSNYQVYPGTQLHQWEVSIVTNPNNPDILFIAANTFLSSSGFTSEGIYVSTDGGNSWRGADTCYGQPLLLHGGDPGIVIDKNNTFILTRKGFSSGLYSHYSTNNGLTWSDQKIISLDDLAPERAGIVSDSNPESIYCGRTYVLWVQLSPPFPVTFSSTDDGAQSWAASQQINNPSQRSAGGELAIDEDGKLYACWAAVTNSSPFTEDYIGFASSSNGGSNWTLDENAYDINGIAGVLTQKSNIRVNGLPRIAVDTSGGQRHGWIYVVTGQKNLSPAGNDPDVILNRSSDGGQTWSPGIRVNRDVLSNGKVQLFPTINVDKYGGVNIIFYDDRNTASDSFGVFLARSEDGGDSWREFEISDHNFKPVPIGGVPQGKMGDNIGFTSSNETLWPVWMDNSSGLYKIWTVPIDLSTVEVESQEIMPIKFSLDQNYPNPFNSSTRIKYSIEETEFVRMKIYDILGNEIAVIVNEEKSSGVYEVNFNAGNLPGGVYFYKLTAGKHSVTKKLVLLK